MSDRRHGRRADIAAALFVLDHQTALTATGTVAAGPLPPRPLWQRIAAVTAGALVIAAVGGATVWFATRPEVSQAFSEPHFGRADALILVFSTLFLAPFALFIALVLLVFAIAMVGGFVLPVVRWLSLPDWIATAVVIVGGGMAAWVQSAHWLPRSVWFLGLLARAWKVILA